MTYDYDYWYDGGLNIDFASVYSIGGVGLRAIQLKILLVIVVVDVYR